MQAQKANQIIITMQQQEFKKPTTVFNPTQIHLLRMFSYMNDDRQLQDLKSVLAEYYFQQVEKGMSSLEEQGLWNAEMAEAVSKEHLRTPYIH